MEQPQEQAQSVKTRKPRKAAESKEGKVDGRTFEGRLEKVKAEYQSVCKSLSELRIERDKFLEEAKILRTLLASFNALTHDGDIKLVKPEVGTPYWYLRAMPTVKRFEVVPCQWNDWKSDHYRYVKGNMFLDLYTVNTVCQAANKMLAEL